MTVPENRASGSDRRVEIPVVTFPSGEPDRYDDPIVYVSGGPGFASIFSAMQLLTTWPEWINYLDWLAGRDLIIFDPRGSGLARPSLDCPEEKTRSEEYPLFVIPKEALRACLEKLRDSGIDLGAYTTPALAADLNDLRRAMGIESWNIWAESHGTRVALEAIRQDERGIRSAILSSPYPPGVDDPRVITRNFDRILTELIASCALHQLCAEFAPDLPAMFQELLRDLRENPRELKTLSPHSYLERTYEINDAAYLEILFNLAYHYQGLRVLPFIVIISHQGRLDFSPFLASDLIGFSPYMSFGAHVQILCGDGGLASPKQIQEARDIVPYLAGWADDFWTSEDCRDVIGQQEPALDPSPVESDLPVLLISGAFDPVTPSEWARVAAEGLPNSHLFVFPGDAHTASNNPCAQLIMKRYLDSPESNPSDPCFLLETGPRPGP